MVNTCTAIQGVVACATFQRVDARATGEHIGAAVTPDDVVEFITGAVDGSCTAQDQILEVCSKRVGNCACHGIDARGGAIAFHHHITEVVDDIAVVAVTAGHGVGASLAIQRIVASIASQAVAACVTRAIDVTAACQHQLLDVCPQRIGECGSDGVRACTPTFRDRIARTIDDVGVITRTTYQRVVARSAIQSVISGVARKYVVAAVARGVDGGETA